MLIVRAQRADPSLGLLSLLLDKISRPAATFSRDNNPSVKQIVLAQFVEHHEQSSNKHWNRGGLHLAFSKNPQTKRHVDYKLHLQRSEMDP